MEMHVKPDHRAARAFIDLNSLHVQRVHREDIAVGFPFWRRRAAVARFTEVSTRLNGTFRQGNQV